MRLFILELKKLFLMPMLWVFLIISLLFNGLLTATERYDWEFVRYVSQITAEIGQKADGGYIYRLENPDFSLGRNAASVAMDELNNELAGQVVGMVNIFETYEASVLGEKYIEQLGLTGLTAQMMESKYGKLQGAVDLLAEEDAAMDVYAAASTPKQHKLLFGTIMKALLTEGILLAVLLMIYILGYERQSRTNFLVCSTKVGRGTLSRKILAGISAGIFGYAAVCLPTLLLFFTIWDYSGFWDANVASQFNYVTEAMAVKPFITWASFTVGEYLMAAILLSTLLIVVFSLLSAFIALQIDHTYMAFLAFILTAAIMVTATMLFGDMKLWEGYFLSMLTPVMIWVTQGLWMTEMGSSALIPWQETAGILLNLILLLLLNIFAYRRFRRKDLAI